MEFVKAFKEARRVSVPLVVVRTADAESTVRKLSEALKDPQSKNQPPILYWDVMVGLVGKNALGKQVAAKILNGADPQMATARPAEMLEKATAVLDDSVLFMANSQLYWNTIPKDAYVIQGIFNLRDKYKTKGCMFIMLTTIGAMVPPELVDDTMVFDDPYPTEAELAEIVRRAFKDEGMKEPKVEVVEKCVDALTGLSSFTAEQVMAMCLNPMSGPDYDGLWDRKRSAVEQTKGLSIWKGGEKFSDIGGVENAKTYFQRIINGKEAPKVIVFVDEIEKAFAGTGTDLSGVKTEMTGTWLTWMEDKGASGTIFIGPPGCSKTLLAKAVGNEAGIPTVYLDFSAMQASLVGQSGDNLRAALRIIEAISGKQIFVIATCNRITSLPPEVRRRFSAGTFFFDLPTKAEREVIWKIYLKKYGLTDKDRPKDEGWTGAEIRNCCQQAYRLEISLKEAANYVVPVAKSAEKEIEQLREMANGRFISASEPGPYVHTKSGEEEDDVNLPRKGRVVRISPDSVGNA